MIARKQMLLSLSICFALFSVAQSQVIPSGWVSHGPYRFSDTYATEKLQNAPSIIGAVSNIVLMGDVAYIGTVNGGVWKSDNIHATTSVHWRPLTDTENVTCSSINGLSMDKDNNLRVAAGCGNPSNYMSYASELNGVMLTLDGGATWKMTNFPKSLHITDVVARAPAVIVASVRREVRMDITISNTNQRGIWVTNNNGESWSKVPMPGASAGTSSEMIYRLVADPSDPNFMVAASPLGIYVTSTGGMTSSAWQLTSSGLDTTLVGTANNAVLSVVSLNGQRIIWAGYTQCGNTGTCSYGIFWSTNDGGSWNALSEPGTQETYGFEGLGPQGDPNFSLLGDPTNLNIVYVGGTTQARLDINSLGAEKYTGRLFRGDRSAASSSQWTALTHTGTAHQSSPHADSRYFAWDYSTGNLVNSNDGGIFYRTLPRSPLGDWYALNGDLAISEFLSASYEPNTKVFIAGAQDNGVFMSNPNLPSNGSLAGVGILSGDGGSTSIDPNNGKPRFYITNQYVGLAYAYIDTFSSPTNYLHQSPSSSTYNANRAYMFYFDKDPVMPIPADSTPMQPLILMNAVQPGRLVTCLTRPVVGCFVMIPPSANSNQQVIKLTSKYFSVYAYGGKLNGVADPEVFLGVSSTAVIARKTGNLNPATTNPAYSWGSCSCLTLNPENYREAIMTCYGPSNINSDGSDVYVTRDFGSSWTKITGNLKQATGVLYDFKPQSTLIMNLPNNERAYLVGTWKGLYASLSSDTTQSWLRVGSVAEFPTVFAQRMQYEPVSDRLVVATMGRGIYSIPTATTKITSLLHPGPINCSLGGWEVAGSCSAGCDGGTIPYQQRVIVQGMFGGTPCPSLAQRTEYRVCNTQLCDKARAVQLRLNVDVATASTQTFQETFITKAAAALGIDKSRLQIVAVFSGSAMLIVNILPDPTSTPAFPSPINAVVVAQSLSVQVTNSNSPLVTALAAANIPVDTSYTPTVTSSTWQKCTDGTWKTSCPAPTTPPDYSMYLYYALGGLGVIFFCAVFCSCICYRKLHAAAPEPSEQQQVAVKIEMQRQQQQQFAPSAPPVSMPRVPPAPMMVPTQAHSQTHGEIQLTVNPLHRRQ